MSYVFLALFWAGMVFLTYKNKYSLKARAIALAGSAKESAGKLAKNTRLYAFVNGLRLSSVQRAESRELAECLSYVKNIAVLGNSRGISVQYLLEELADFSRLLRPAFTDMARYIDVNDKESAAECLHKCIGTPLSADVGAFLAGWDDIPPAEVTDMLDAYQNTLNEERATQLRKREETISDLVYFPVVIDCMIVLVNFIYIAYFLEQQDALSLLL